MFRRHGYRLARALIRLIARPRIAGAPPDNLPAEAVYALARRSLFDLVVLDLVCAERDWPNPLSGLRLDGQEETRRTIFLARPAGLWRRNTMRTVPERLARLVENPAAPESRVALVPVQVFWGRTTNREKSLIGTLFSEHWATTSRLRRFVNILVSRNHIVVDFGEPLALGEAARGDQNGEPAAPHGCCGCGCGSRKWPRSARTSRTGAPCSTGLCKAPRFWRRSRSGFERRTRRKIPKNFDTGCAPKRTKRP